MAYWEPESLMALTIVFLNLTTILTVLRYLKIRLERQRVGLDDLALTIAWLLNIAIDVNMITGVAYGFLGRKLPVPTDGDGYQNIWAYNTPPQVSLDKFYYVQEIILPLQLACSKLSIVLFYRRTLVVARQGFMHWATLTTIILVGLWGLTFFFLNVFQCGTRFRLIWDGPLALEMKYCVSVYKDIVYAATDVVLDLIIVALPLHRIFTLRLTLAKKIQVAGVFTLGALSVAGAAVRLAVHASEFLGVDNVFTDVYPTIFSSIIMFWGAFEAGFAVATASLPGLQPLFNRVGAVLSQKWTTARSKSFETESIESEKPGLIMVKQEFEVRVSSP